MKGSSLRVAGIVVFGTLMYGSGSVSAGTVTVSGEDPKASISVTVNKASVADVLAELHEKYGFEVEDLANAGGDALDATMSGNLIDIVQRLLRNRNHVIVRSYTSASGIERVVIINESIGKAASQTKQDKALLQQIQNAQRVAGE